MSLALKAKVTWDTQWQQQQQNEAFSFMCVFGTLLLFVLLLFSHWKCAAIRIVRWCLCVTYGGEKCLYNSYAYMYGRLYYIAIHVYLAISKCPLFRTLCTAMSTTMCGDARGLHLNEERKRKMTANDGVAWPAIRHTKRDRWQTKVSGFSHNVPCLLYGNMLLYICCSFTLYMFVYVYMPTVSIRTILQPSIHDAITICSFRSSAYTYMCAYAYMRMELENIIIKWAF